MNQDRLDAVPFLASATCTHSPLSGRMSLADTASPRCRRGKTEREREMENALLGKKNKKQKKTGQRPAWSSRGCHLSLLSTSSSVRAEKRKRCCVVGFLLIFVCFFEWKYRQDVQQCRTESRFIRKNEELHYRSDALSCVMWIRKIKWRNADLKDI